MLLLLVLKLKKIVTSITVSNKLFLLQLQEVFLEYSNYCNVLNSSLATLVLMATLHSSCAKEIR